MKKILIIMICLSFVFPSDWRNKAKKEKRKIIIKHIVMGTLSVCVWSSAIWTTKQLMNYNKKKDLRRF
jgi:hypothetical protein